MPFFQKRTYFSYKALLWFVNRIPFLLNSIPKKYSLYYGKRVFSFIFRRKCKGSMTLETALVLPIFLFAIMSLISGFNVIKIKGYMDVAITEVGNEISLKNYNILSSDLMQPIVIKQKINQFLNENLSKRDREMISERIYVTNLSLFETDGRVSFRVDYSITPEFNFLGVVEIPLHCSYYGQSWLGYETKKNMENVVFLSENAEVYHTDKTCSYLEIEIIEIAYDQLSTYKNNIGKKYGVCGFCGKSTKLEKVYVTAYGRNYHTVKTCIGLTRTSYTVPESTVLGMKKCSRCEGNK